MKSLAVAAIFFLLCPPLRAEDIHVIDARRNIPLSDDEPVYKDYYLNAGEGSGLKKNLVVNVVRKVTVRDASGSQTVGEMTVPVAQIKILAVYGKVSVARDYKPLSREDFPMLEQAGIMGGDLIEFKGSFVDTKKPEPKVVEAAKPEPPREAASVAPATPTTLPTAGPQVASAAGPKEPEAVPASSTPPPAKTEHE